MARKGASASPEPPAVGAIEANPPDFTAGGLQESMSPEPPMSLTMRAVFGYQVRSEIEEAAAFHIHGGYEIGHRGRLYPAARGMEERNTAAEFRLCITYAFEHGHCHATRHSGRCHKLPVSIGRSHGRSTAAGPAPKPLFNAILNNKIRPCRGRNKTRQRRFKTGQRRRSKTGFSRICPQTTGIERFNVETRASFAGYGSAGGQPERRAMPQGPRAPAVACNTSCRGPLAQSDKLRGFGGSAPMSAALPGQAGEANDAGMKRYRSFIAYPPILLERHCAISTAERSMPPAPAPAWK